MSTPEISIILYKVRPLSNGRYRVVMRVNYLRKWRYLEIEKLSATPQEWLEGNYKNGQPNLVQGAGARS